MSYFNDLCKAYGSARDRYHNYRDDARSFIIDLVKGFIKHIEIPEDLIIYYPPNEEYDPRKTYTPNISLDKDSYWHFKFQMTIYEFQNKFPQQPILMDWKFKKKENGYIIIAEEEGKVWEINPTSDLDKCNFYDYLYNLIKNLFDNKLEEFLEKNSTNVERIMGFTSKKNA